MHDIFNWFTELKEQEPDYADLVDKIVEAISEDVFDSSILNIWITQELRDIETEYKIEFQKERNGES